MKSTLPIIHKIFYDSTDKNDNMLIPWYIMASYAYYVDDNPIITDDMFDRMSKRLLAVWDDVEHEHKQCLSKEMLVAGTYLGEYPSRIKYALDSLRGVK